MQAFVPKNRKPKFDLTLRIIDLTNIPLIAGTATVRWHLSSSSAADHRGRTPSAPIAEHKATWEYLKTQPVRLTIDKKGSLEECDIHFEVLQEFHDGGARGGRMLLGNIKLNLAEYTRLPGDGSQDLADEGEEEGSITRRYLLQDSKVNSTLKIGIRMFQTEGDINFTAPPLKSAMVVGGIAGVLTTEAGVLASASGTPGEANDIPSITSKTRELSEAQDIYRRTLAATWACRAGELAPDKLIENLFSGGDGGRPHPPKEDREEIHANSLRIGSGGAVGAAARDQSMNSNSSSSDETRHHHNSHHNSHSHWHSHPNHHPNSSNNNTTPRANLTTPQTTSLLTPQMANTTSATTTQSSSHKRGTSRDSPNLHLSMPPPPTFGPNYPAASTVATIQAAHATGVSGRSSIDQQIQQSQQQDHRRNRSSDYAEYTEFDLRDDLRSWSVRVS